MDSLFVLVCLFILSVAGIGVEPDMDVGMLVMFLLLVSSLAAYQLAVVAPQKRPGQEKTAAELPKALERENGSDLSSKDLPCSVSAVPHEGWYQHTTHPDPAIPSSDPPLGHVDSITTPTSTAVLYVDRTPFELPSGKAAKRALFSKSEQSPGRGYSSGSSSDDNDSCSIPVDEQGPPNYGQETREGQYKPYRFAPGEFTSSEPDSLSSGHSTGTCEDTLNAQYHVPLVAEETAG